MKQYTTEHINQAVNGTLSGSRGREKRYSGFLPRVLSASGVIMRFKKRLSM